MTEPLVIAETRDYVVVFKPHGMHGAPLEEGEGDTLLSWCAGLFPEVLRVKGRKEIEGGLLHRLDYETEGLVLLARDQAFYDALTIQQSQGRFVKEYRAVSLNKGSGLPASALPGFPPAPAIQSLPAIIESAFRPFGPGRRSVRPVPTDRAGTERGSDIRAASSARRSRGTAFDRGVPYRTELFSLQEIDGSRVRIGARLERGFRHQVRCHLAWIGFPIQGDRLYGGDGSGSDVMALSAVAVSFIDPVSGSPLRYVFDSSVDSGRNS